MLASESTISRDRIESHAAAEHRRPVDIIPFAAWHLRVLDLQPEQWIVRPILTEEYGRALEVAGGGFSAFAGEDLLAAAGIVAYWPGRSQVWALITAGLRDRVVILHRAIYRAVQQYPGARLECIIDPAFPASVEWARRLGFQYESTMPKYGFDGRTMDMYARVKD